MRIKSLEIHGFKSFVDRTVFRFQPGITAVVGPNGCGKSNVVDAVRWAMGEQAPRRLRGKGMEDMIFSGAEARTPVGMAEVVLAFDNSSGTAPPAFAAYSEIQIARRLYRSGESEYLINKTPCRLRDVMDFFRDTGIGANGYTIVEQGRIADMVSARPEERRLLIEEAAGISKYKARRREAESRIRSTEQNLTRVSDVLGEIRRQIASIERQARKAARHKRLREELRLLDLSVSRDERDERIGEVERTRRRLEGLRGKVTGLETRLAERELALERVRIELAERERLLARGSEVLYGLRGEIKELESRIAYAKRERQSLVEAGEANREELERLCERETGAGAELARIQDELGAVESGAAAAATRLADAEASSREAVEALRVLEREREERSAAHVDVATRIARAEDRSGSLAQRRAQAERRLGAADEALEAQGSEAARLERDERELSDRLRELLAQRDRLMQALRDALARQERCAGEVVAAAGRLRELRERRESLRARLESLRELAQAGDDLNAGARHLLEAGEAARARHGLRGALRDWLDVEPEVARAVEAVLAERASALVVERLEGALTAVADLRERGAGRALFVADRADAAEPLGIVPLGEPLLGRVRPRPGGEGLARVLLGRVNLVDDLAEAVRVYGAGRIPATFVTRDGDLLSPDGVIRGGASAPDGSFSRRSETERLPGQLAGLDREVAEQEARASRAEAAQVEVGREVENLRSRHHSAALAVASLEGDLERARERAKALGERRASGVSERREHLHEIDSLAAELVRVAGELEAARGERVDRQRELLELGQRIGDAGRERARREGAATELRVEHAGRLERQTRLADEQERTRSLLSETRVWIARRRQEIADGEARREVLAASIAEAQEQLAARLREEESARASNDQRREAYEQEAEAVRALEHEARALRGEIQSARETLQQGELELRDQEFRLRQLEDAVRERWGVDLSAWTPPVPGEGAESAPAADAAAEDEEGGAPYRPDPALLELPREERSRRSEEVRERLEALGEVNLGAIEEHEELRERMRFLSEQKQDLDATLHSLREAIQRINRQSRKRFRAAFEAVSERFREIFPRLFRGGKAGLWLTESEDVLEAGVEIMAQPPGKRLQNMGLLSGGEKTLTALALLLALFQVRPSPFFLLDEVDAALDDANVGRFNEIVREMAKQSQFIVITHNKRTIEVAGILYGLTMERLGISKLVSVDLRA